MYKLKLKKKKFKKNIHIFVKFIAYRVQSRLFSIDIRYLFRFNVHRLFIH